MWHVSQPPRAPPVCGCSAAELPSSAWGEPKASLWGGKSSFLDYRLNWQCPLHARPCHSNVWRETFLWIFSHCGFQTLLYQMIPEISFQPGILWFSWTINHDKKYFRKKSAFRETSPFYSGFDTYIQVFWEFRFLNILPLMVQVSNKNYLIIWIFHNCLWVFFWKKFGINHNQRQDSAEKNHWLTQDWSLMHYSSDMS